MELCGADPGRPPLDDAGLVTVSRAQSTRPVGNIVERPELVVRQPFQRELQRKPRRCPPTKTCCLQASRASRGWHPSSRNNRATSSWPDRFPRPRSPRSCSCGETQGDPGSSAAICTSCRLHPSEPCACRCACSRRIFSRPEGEWPLPGAASSTCLPRSLASVGFSGGSGNWSSR